MTDQVQPPDASEDAHLLTPSVVCDAIALFNAIIVRIARANTALEQAAASLNAAKTTYNERYEERNAAIADLAKLTSRAEEFIEDPESDEEFIAYMFP